MGELHNYADWVRQRNAAQQEAPQPFDNKLHTYTYIPNAQPGGAAPFTPVTTTPQTFTTWPQPYQYFGLPQACAYPQYNQGYHFAPQANLAPQPAAPLVGGCPGGVYYYPQAQAAAPRQAGYDRGAYGYHHIWYGRTKAEVDADNLLIARNEGVNNPGELAPHNPRDDQQFWVQELDGQFTLRTYYTIENDLRPGRWAINPTHGNLFYIRQAAN